MFRPKSWFSGLSSKPRNPHSLEHLKYLYGMLCKNQTVNEYNRSLLVETLRSISEILIWGDQNDSSVFDFFLEKNMLSFFLRYLRQKSGRYICVQLLQTLNILFENISNETSLYYLLSNNHVNSIIVHKFDFSDEEVMAYYISFLKTLSLKLNKHTIHFFYNEHTNDFALYTEAIKFFNHSENMVRIAVRTIILNVYRVEDKAMLRYIRDHTAAPYFSNLVWFIGNHILDLDTCVRNDADTELIRRMKRYQIANYKCLIIKYAKDDRYSKGGIATHDRNTLPAIPAEKLNDLKHEAEKYDVIGIDEGQFFPDVVSFSDQMAERGKIIIVAALDGTFQRKGFGDILQLVPIAESVIKLSAVCMKCNNEGHFTKRKTQETSVEVIGGADKYLAVCRACFQSPIKQSPNKTNSTPSMKPIPNDKANRKLFTFVS